uniref:Phospholipid phosphatase-related protein type 3 n=1 Tax=Monopterus albus TaxID=43700 RepID=A0A3Q3JS79_MONAL|nr:phospholipid phosphatase-related protein type 4 [Monopterus albus]
MSAREKGILTKDSISLLPCFYFVELPILVSSVVSVYFLEWTDVFKPVKSGFNCHDRSLSLPYIDPSHEVIPLLMLLSLAFAGPAITIMIGEAIRFCCLSRRKSGAGAEANINAAGCNFNSFIRRAIRFIGVHAFGLCATALITDILQLMTGYPTPYFLTVCKPNYSTLIVSCEQNPYVMEDICSGADPTAINQGRKSFPSQHATLASFAAVYVSMYFNSTLTDSSKLLKPLLVFSFIICAIICGLTRIIQYKNHAIDVYLGFLIGGAIAVYLGLYAVGNFQPSEVTDTKPPLLLPRPPCSLPHISQEAILRHLQMKASMAQESTIPTSHSEGLLHRGLQQQRPDDGLKFPSAEMDVISPNSSESKDGMLTFSHTLPRVHTPQAMAAYEEAARHHAATLHHASMDTSRSKQLLSQWKNKHNNHKCSMQVPDIFYSSVDSSSGQSSQHLHHHGSIELRSSSEPSAADLNGGFDGHAYMSAGASTTLPSNCSGITGGARICMQSRPGSSQLVHIPEEAHENYNAMSPRTAGGGSEVMSAVNNTVQANWQHAAEKTTACRTNDSGQNTQARIMHVIAMFKQQGLLQTHSKSLDESSITGSCQGSVNYRALADQEPTSTTGPSSLGSTIGNISGSTGAIVRVEAHPENNRPVIQAPSTDGSGSWRWRSLDHGTGAGGGAGTSGAEGGSGGGSGSMRQSFELNDLNRDSESSDSIREGSLDRKCANHIITTTATISTTPIITVHSQSTSQSEQRLHPQGLSTIRVTPGDGSVSGSGGGSGGGGSRVGDGESASETPSVTSSCESALRKKGNNIILIPERANSSDNARNIFYKGTSITSVFKD